MFKLLMKLKRDERGISALEYAVLAAIIIVALVAALEVLDITQMFQGAADSLIEAGVLPEGGES